MKFLKDLVNSQEKLFEKGGKLERLYPLYEAGASFLFSTKETSKSNVHVRDSLDTKRYMSVVILALIPCILFGIYNSGLQSHIAGGQTLDLVPVILTGLKLSLPIIIVSYAVGGIWELLFALIRRHEINEGFLVTGILFPLTLPSTIPLWQVAMGISFGVIIGKEVFGGSGRNFLNPALTARAFLFFTYPAYISGDAVWISTNIWSKVADGYSGATALAVAAAAKAPETVTTLLVEKGFTWNQLFLGFVPGSIGETSTVCVLLGAGLLLITKVGSWRTMVGCLAGAVSTAWIFNVFSTSETLPFLALPPEWHIVMGSFAFAAVFMATDPVSSPTLETSKLIYGFLIGVMGIVIRCINPAYPEGWMLSILLLNVFAPTIDHYVLASRTKKRIPNVI